MNTQRQPKLEMIQPESGPVTIEATATFMMK